LSKILLQTTIMHDPLDWDVDRFSLLGDELRAAGHEVTARDRDDYEKDDPVLSALPELDYDQVWLIGVDQGNGLTPGDAKGILRFRENGGGVLTSRDHQDLGCCLSSLGSLGEVNLFHTVNPDPAAARDDQDNPNISWPNWHSGANGDYQPVFALAPDHSLLQTPSGPIEWFPAHPHEGSVMAPPESPFATVIAQGRSSVSGRRFNLAVALENERTSAGRPLGRALAESTFHHFADYNWDIDAGAPDFVTDPPGHEMRDDPSRLEIFKEYVRNIADWLHRPSAGAASSRAAIQDSAST
jgi:hypothetical protein